jgi:hypothetical protein
MALYINSIEWGPEMVYVIFTRHMEGKICRGILYQNSGEGAQLVKGTKHVKTGSRHAVTVCKDTIQIENNSYNLLDVDNFCLENAGEKFEALLRKRLAA